MNITYLLPLVCFWHTITTEISKYKPDVITNNIVCSIHSLLFILHYNYNYNLDYTTHISIGFYLYDLLYIISCVYRAKSTNANEVFKRRVPYIIHHLIGVYLLNASLTGENRESMLHGYNLLETSNIMIYVSYHLHKEYASHTRVIVFSEFIQLVWYVYYRIFLFSVYAYEVKSDVAQFCLTTRCSIFVVYCMGLMWSYNLVKKNINALKELHRYGTSMTPDSKLNCCNINRTMIYMTLESPGIYFRLRYLRDRDLDARLADLTRRTDFL